MCSDCSFAAGYVLNDQIGVVVYKVGARGTWSGLSAFANKIDDETEILTPVKQSWRG
jgi:hypothetical protein